MNGSLTCLRNGANNAMGRLAISVILAAVLANVATAQLPLPAIEPDDYGTPVRVTSWNASYGNQNAVVYTDSAGRRFARYTDYDQTFYSWWQTFLSGRSYRNNGNLVTYNRPGFHVEANAFPPTYHKNDIEEYRYRTPAQNGGSHVVEYEVVLNPSRKYAEQPDSYTGFQFVKTTPLNTIFRYTNYTWAPTTNLIPEGWSIIHDMLFSGISPFENSFGGRWGGGLYAGTVPAHRPIRMSPFMIPENGGYVYGDYVFGIWFPRFLREFRDGRWYEASHITVVVQANKTIRDQQEIAYYSSQVGYEDAAVEEVLRGWESRGSFDRQAWVVEGSAWLPYTLSLNPSLYNVIGETVNRWSIGEIGVKSDIPVEDGSTVYPPAPNVMSMRVSRYAFEPVNGVAFTPEKQTPYNSLLFVAGFRRRSGGGDIYSSDPNVAGRSTLGSQTARVFAGLNNLDRDLEIKVVYHMYLLDIWKNPILGTPTL